MTSTIMIITKIDRAFTIFLIFFLFIAPSLLNDNYGLWKGKFKALCEPMCLFRNWHKRQTDHVCKQPIRTGVVDLELPIPHECRIKIGALAVAG